MTAINSFYFRADIAGSNVVKVEFHINHSNLIEVGIREPDGSYLLDSGLSSEIIGPVEIRAWAYAENGEIGFSQPLKINIVHTI
ncbi:MAG: hypothetical protein HY092_03145 [Candidatus Kerfeldbacteria bacterium]|nr:hypothetical protein [Candidatus Kerfeldbacteria bacterium]